MKRFAIALCGLTFVLLIVGGLVSATESGLACPDWPTCHGTFTPSMIGGVRFEYTHRLVAGSVGLCSVILAIWAWTRRREDVRFSNLTLGAVGLVIFQGLLGALTVKLELPPQVSITHLGTSMLFFSLTVVIAWHAVHAGNAQTSPTPFAKPLQPWLVPLATAAIYAQVVLGALVRHTRSGLACTDLPLCNGALFPAGAHVGVQIHMAHRLMGVIAGTLAIAACIAVFRASAGQSALRRISAAVPVMILVQIALGAGIILTWRDLATMTLHQATGAAILAAMVSTWVLTRRPAALLSRASETHPATLAGAEGAKA